MDQLIHLDYLPGSVISVLSFQVCTHLFDTQDHMIRSGFIKQTAVCVDQGAVQGPEEFAEGFVIGVRSLLGHTVGKCLKELPEVVGTSGLKV